MPAKFVSNRDETIPLFRNPWLERLSHVHPITPVVMYVPLAVYVSWRAGEVRTPLQLLGLLLSGVALWTLTEYTLHRWVFHYQPRSAWGQRLHFLMHGIHHDYPRDSTRLVMPPAVSVPLAVLFFYLFRAAFPGTWDGLFAGFLLGYVAYDSIHYATHHWPMKSGVGKFLKEYHLKHHYLDDRTAYGVSSPTWDYVFRTVPEWVEVKEPART